MIVYDELEYNRIAVELGGDYKIVTWQDNLDEGRLHEKIIARMPRKLVLIRDWSESAKMNLSRHLTGGE